MPEGIRSVSQSRPNGLDVAGLDQRPDESFRHPRRFSDVASRIDFRELMGAHLLSNPFKAKALPRRPFASRGRSAGLACARVA
jgi:hypothetical protein